MSLDKDGFEIVPGGVSSGIREQLRDTLFQPGSAGTRCLLDEPLVRETAIQLRQKLVNSGHLPLHAVAIQAIAFDKTPATNWKVAWHQDLMFPFAQPVRSPGFDLPSKKAGIDYARPPVERLEQLLAVRLHLDPCDETNGPLRVAAGTHRLGILPVDKIPECLADMPQYVCEAQEGTLLLMRPLLLHASSQATAPKHRRVLHFVYDTGGPIQEAWHRNV
jgi:ectoine hydroxylase-related dioxygenase (phytanoyl-CoA dioxygenase family)